MRKISLRILCISFIFIAVYSCPSLSQTTPKDKARQHYRLGQIYYEHGLFDEAKQEFKKALDILGELPPQEVEKQTVKNENIKASTPQPERPSGKEYIIGVGDVIDISVWENPDLNKEVIVRPDGKISFPLINDVRAQGLTITELDDEITLRLKDYIKYPDVSVSLKKIGGSRIIVLGEVGSPGVYSIEDRKTVLEAIALAGGFTRDAVLNSVIVIKGGFAHPEATRVNLASALRKGKLKEDIGLNAQDIVYVPKKFIANLNYFLKQFLEPISRGIYTANEFNNFGE
ncbi:MAG: hypothetical protein B1H08_02065 [Candidatus Omnitrophica bacterium 4484_171]|nr:MAG: hypothetical protein B1H08_02065 [Candidatus Omnitrophica bacterium 4484_171]